MEYTRIEHGDEVVLTYRPKEPVQPVILRYERDLPARMQTTAEPKPPAQQPVAKPDRKPVSELLQTPVKRKRNGLAVTVCDSSIIQNLKKHIEYIRVCFFDFVKKYY